MNVQANRPEAITPEDQDMGNFRDFGFDLVGFLRVLRVRRQIILGTALAVVALTVVITAQITPLYTASAVVILDTRKNTVEDASSVLSSLSSDQISMQNQVQILTSRGLAGRVTDKYKLDQLPEFNPQMSKPGLFSFLKNLNPLNWLPRKTESAIQGDDVHDATIDKVLKAEDVEPIGLSSAMTINFSSRDPVLSGQIANGIAEAYVEDQLNAKFEANQKATQWLGERIGELARQTQAAEAAVADYKSQHNITDTTEGRSLVTQQTGDISSQLVIARSELAGKQAIYNHVAALAREGRAADISQAVSSQLISQLRSAEADLARQEADLLSKYGPRHPKILDLQSQKANLEGKIADEVQRVVESVRSDAAIAQAKVSSLQASLAGLKSESSSEGGSRVKLSQLESAATTSRAMYETYMGRLNQARGQEGITTPDSRIISRAQIPTGPSFPKTGLFIAASIPAGLLLGLILAFMAERLDSGFRTTRQVEEILGLPVFSTVPEISDDSSDVAARVIDKPVSAYSEAIRGIQLGLLLASGAKRRQVVLLTSSVPTEGKSTLSASLARQGARGGLKTLIIDADLRRPVLSKVMKVTPTNGGLIEVLTGEKSLAECLVKDSVSEVDLLPCFKPPKNPFDLLGSEAMQQLLVKLRTIYDLIIVDSAPVLPVHDTKHLSPYADSVVLIVRWEKTPRDAVAKSVRDLSDVGVKVSGIVLSRANPERFQYYNYGYQDYEGYNKYYNGG